MKLTSLRERPFDFYGGGGGGGGRYFETNSQDRLCNKKISRMDHKKKN